MKSPGNCGCAISRPIVLDLIDMEETGTIAPVERRLKEL